MSLSTVSQGAYRDDAGNPFVLSSVLEAEQRVVAQLAAGTLDKEYSGIEGEPSNPPFQ